MGNEFAPKDAETLKAEITADLGIEYEGSEELVDKMVARELKSEEFKASLHKDKMSQRDKLKETRKLAGLDPETGEKIVSKETKQEEAKNEGMTAKDVIAIRDLHEADVEFVMAEAKLRGISIAEAKANSYIQNTLKMLAEERKTAEATNTTSTRRSSSQTSPAAVISRAYKNELKDDEMSEAAKNVLDDIFKKK